MAFNNGIDDLRNMKLLELADLLHLDDQRFNEWLVQAGFAVRKL